MINLAAVAFFLSYIKGRLSPLVQRTYFKEAGVLWTLSSSEDLLIVVRRKENKVRKEVRMGEL